MNIVFDLSIATIVAGSNRMRLRIKERLLILQQSLSLNKQHEGFEGVLQLRPHVQSREPLPASQTTVHLPTSSPTDQREDHTKKPRPAKQ